MDGRGGDGLGYGKRSGRVSVSNRLNAEPVVPIWDRRRQHRALVYARRVNAPQPMTSFRCLMIEDDSDFASMVISVVSEQGGEVTHVTTIGAGREELGRRAFDLEQILDNRLPDGTGHEFCPQLLARLPEALVIMITGAPEISAAVALTRNGLFDYLSKPVDLGALRKALERAKLRWSRPDAASGSEWMVGDAPIFRATLERLRNAAQHAQAIVLLLGETGTGKDMAARQLHAWTSAARGGASLRAPELLGGARGDVRGGVVRKRTRGVHGCGSAAEWRRRGRRGRHPSR